MLRCFSGFGCGKCSNVIGTGNFQLDSHSIVNSYVASQPCGANTTQKMSHTTQKMCLTVRETQHAFHNYKHVVMANGIIGQSEFMEVGYSNSIKQMGL